MMVYFLCNGQFHQLQSNKSSKPNKTVPQLDFCLMWYHFTCIVCAFLPWRALSLFLKECRLFLKGLMLGGFIMTHEDAGHFAAKHPADSALDEKISEAVRTNAPNGKLSCSNASRIANELGIDIAKVGVTADLTETKIDKCMLGLFGYNSDRAHGKAVEANESVDAQMKSEILSAAKDGGIGCDACWAIADKLKVPKMSVASCCDAMEVKISSCQLGAF
jgi:hypothetical protein